MAFKTFTAGEVLTASDVNTYLMKQAVITCTAATRPGTPNEGMLIYETDTDTFAFYDGSGWVYQGYYQSWTPVLSGSGWTFKGYAGTGKYARWGDLVHAVGTITWDGTGAQVTGSGAVVSTLPVNSSSSERISQTGTLAMLDNSELEQYSGLVRINGSNELFIMPLLVSGSAVKNYSITTGGIGAGVVFPTDADDTLRFSVVYQAA